MIRQCSCKCRVKERKDSPRAVMLASQPDGACRLRPAMALIH